MKCGGVDKYQQMPQTLKELPDLIEFIIIFPAFHTGLFTLNPVWGSLIAKLGITANTNYFNN